MPKKTGEADAASGLGAFSHNPFFSELSRLVETLGSTTDVETLFLVPPPDFGDGEFICELPVHLRSLWAASRRMKRQHQDWVQALPKKAPSEEDQQKLRLKMEGDWRRYSLLCSLFDASLREHLGCSKKLKLEVHVGWRVVSVTTSSNIYELCFLPHWWQK